MQTQLSLSAIGQIIDGTHENPASLLGAHPVSYLGETATAVRSFLPSAHAAWVVDDASGQRRPMRRIHPAGFFEAMVDVESGLRIESTNQSGETVLVGPVPTSDPGSLLNTTRPNGETVNSSLSCNSDSSSWRYSGSFFDPNGL